MDVGLFLDVDNTLTIGLIQHRYAQLLGVDSEYMIIERDFQSSNITSAEFGRRIITLFRGAGLTQAQADSFYSEIPLHEWTSDLLQLPVSKYLVSSGPSYFVRKFAAYYGVPEHNVLCSEYIFDTSGSLSACRAVSAVQKKNYVSQKRHHHFLTIGIGDSPSHDGPFVSECDISLLTVLEPGYLYAENLENLVAMVSKLSRYHSPVPRTVPSVFIGSTAEQIPLADVLHGKVERICNPKVWKDGVFSPSKTNIESLESSLSEFDFAIFLLTPDDVSIVRGVAVQTARDNIILELGLFIGRLGRDRCLLLHPRGQKPELPSDIDGVVMLDYPADRAAQDPESALTSVATKIRERIAERGCRGFRL